MQVLVALDKVGYMYLASGSVQDVCVSSWSGWFRTASFRALHLSLTSCGKRFATSQALTFPDILHSLRRLSLPECWQWTKSPVQRPLLLTKPYFILFKVCLLVCLIIVVNPLTARVVGAPQLILQPFFSIFSCSPLPSGTWRTPGLSIPWCCLFTSSSVCLVFFPLSLCLARWFWPDLMNGRHDHTTAVCVSLRRSGLRVVRVSAGSWHWLPRW